MAAAKSERKAKLNYSTQPFDRDIFVATLSVELSGRNLKQVFFSLKCWWRTDNLSAVYYAFDPQ